MRRDIREEIAERVLTLDGAMGTMIQRCRPTEADFRGERFADHQVALAGCNDLLCLTRPDMIEAIHRAYIEAGADIIETNTFNANAVSLRDYDLGHLSREIARAGAVIARRAAGDDHWVAGSMGPTNVALSMSQADVDFDTMAEAYREQAAGLIEGGVDTILIETAFDTLNAKAAIAGIMDAMELTGREVPLMISATLNENGRLLSGQTLEAFVASVEHARPMTVGLNCGFGAEGMLPFLRRLKSCCHRVSVHPNAGLPDEMGNYVETPEAMASVMKTILDERLANVVGGCCGTTPAHIEAIAALAAVAGVRQVPPRGDVMTLSGLEVLDVRRGDFIAVGERCNVAGSRKFLRLINDGCIDEAVAIAEAQVKAGARVIDVNMDDGMLDARREMTRFVTALSLNPLTATVPLMIDSSDHSVIESALKLIQGRALVNSISLKEGEERFLDQAMAIRRLGAAVVVMAFDEKGQADTLARRIDVCRRSYELLTQRAGFRGDEIVFDPNVLSVATGIADHATYGLDFLEATRWIVSHLPGARVSGGISNLSFSFRGNNALRKAMHAVFIAEGRRRGLDMAIINPTAPIEPTADMDCRLIEAIEDVIINRRDDATDRLVAIATEMKPSPKSTAVRGQAPAQQAGDTKPTLEKLVMTGSTESLEAIISEALVSERSAMAVINGPLMDAMNRVGELFGEGKIFLPQVVRAASVMSKAVEILTPSIEADNNTAASGSTRPLMVLATVKGDVHDIGKNIVSVVMRCSGFDVHDLGVMVDPETIVWTAADLGADMIGLSGLITPSLAQMCRVARLLGERGMKTPLFVGGATTSALHTAVKIAPLTDGLVVHTTDAASLPAVASRISDPAVVARIRASQEKLREEYQRRQPALEIAESRRRGVQVDDPAPSPISTGRFDLSPSIAELRPLINPRALLGEWGIDAAGESAEAKRLLADAADELDRMAADIRARVVISPARRSGPETVTLESGLVLELPRALRSNVVTGRCPSLADFVAEQGDHLGLFAVGVTLRPDEEADRDQYRSLLRQTIGHRLAEACTEWLNRHVTSRLWPVTKTIRPAVGYSCLPRQSLIFDLDRELKLADLGITLTETGAMSPGSSTCGLIVAHPSACYFTTGD